MRSAGVGLAVVGLVLVAGWTGGQGLPQPQASDGKLIAFSSEAGDHQQVTVIDPAARAMSVYHVERATGKITLKSVRNIRADLLMDEFNTESPLPREIRAILGQR